MVCGRLPTFVSDERDNHAVEVEEEHEEVEAEFDEGLLFVHVEFAEDLGGVEEMLVFEDPAEKHILAHHTHMTPAYIVFEVRGVGCVDILLPIPNHKRQIQQQRQPISINEK